MGLKCLIFDEDLSLKCITLQFLVFSSFSLVLPPLGQASAKYEAMTERFLSLKAQVLREKLSRFYSKCSDFQKDYEL